MYTHNAPYSYKDESTIPELGRIIKSRWSRKRTRKAVDAARLEIEVSRIRIQALAVEVSEWRWKVGGASYSRTGPEFMGIATRGMKDRGHFPIPISDDDLKG